MYKRRELGAIAIVTATLFVLAAPAHAYVDPGTASAAWAFGLAPVVGFLGWLGRSLLRKVLRRGKDEDEEADDKGEGAEGDQQQGEA